MFTQNFYNLLCGQMAGKSIENCFRAKNGSRYTQYMKTGSGFTSFVNAFKKVATISTESSIEGTVFGWGTEEPKLSDYCVTGDIGYGYSGFQYYAYNETDASNFTGMQFRYTLLNAAPEELTITEFGNFATVYYASSSYTPAMLYRELLPVPLVLPAEGGSASVIISYDFSDIVSLS